MKITKVLTFDAGHRLSDYEGKCKNLHGHTYTIEITIEGELNELGMVMDFSDLKELYKNIVESKFDHKTLIFKDDPLNKTLARAVPNEWLVLLDYNPTVENIAHDIFNMLNSEFNQKSIKLSKIKLWETPNSFAEVTNE